MHFQKLDIGIDIFNLCLGTFSSFVSAFITIFNVMPYFNYQWAETQHFSNEELRNPLKQA